MNKNTSIMLRVSDKEKEKIKREARKMKMSMSEYLLHLFRREEGRDTKQQEEREA